jgi:T5SS/PEP-CTERM-associated repeat protein
MKQEGAANRSSSFPVLYVGVHGVLIVYDFVYRPVSWRRVHISSQSDRLIAICSEIFFVSHQSGNISNAHRFTCISLWGNVFKARIFASQSVSMAMATTAFAVFTSRRESLSMRKISTLFLAMNISYCNLWNPILGTWVAVSEITRVRGKRKPRAITFVKILLTCPLRPLTTALILTGLLAASGSAIAQTTTWNIAGPGNWSTVGNWNTGLPNGGVTARVDTAGAQVTLNSAGMAQALQIEALSEVVVSTGGSLVVGDSISLGRTSGAGAARLTIQGGGTVSALRLFAGDGPYQGIVTVTGAGSSLTVAPAGPAPSQRFLVGGLGAGELHIDAGANVTVNGTRTLHLGYVANGTLFIGSGAGAGTLTADSVILGTTGSSVQFNHTGTQRHFQGPFPESASSPKLGPAPPSSRAPTPTPAPPPLTVEHCRVTPAACRATSPTTPL